LVKTPLVKTLRIHRKNKLEGFDLSVKYHKFN
jgi:hypothetical protein